MLERDPNSVGARQENHIPPHPIEDRDHPFGIAEFAVCPPGQAETVLLDVTHGPRVVAIGTGPRLPCDRMRKRRGEGDHRLVPVNVAQEVPGRHLPVVIDEEQSVLQEDRDLLAFVETRVDVAVVAVGEFERVAGGAVELPAVDRVTGGGIDRKNGKFARTGMPDSESQGS